MILWHIAPEILIRKKTFLCIFGWTNSCAAILVLIEISIHWFFQHILFCIEYNWSIDHMFHPFFFSWRSTVVSFGYCSKIPHPGWLNQQEFISYSFESARSRYWLIPAVFLFLPTLFMGSLTVMEYYGYILMTFSLNYFLKFLFPDAIALRLRTWNS